MGGVGIGPCTITNGFELHGTLVTGNWLHSTGVFGFFTPAYALCLAFFSSAVCTRV